MIDAASVASQRPERRFGGEGKFRPQLRRAARRVRDYVALLDERVDVWKPVEAEELSSERYLILGPVPEDERWEFQPGTIVRVEMKMLAKDVTPELTPVAVE